MSCSSPPGRSPPEAAYKKAHKKKGARRPFSFFSCETRTSLMFFMGLCDIVFQFGVDVLFFYFFRLLHQFLVVGLEPGQLLLAIGPAGQQHVEYGDDKYGDG